MNCIYVLLVLRFVFDFLFFLFFLNLFLGDGYFKLKYKLCHESLFRDLTALDLLNSYNN